MPEVSYKTSQGMKKKTFPYNKSGVSQARKFAKETNGKLNMSLNKSAKLKYKKSYA
tara:strand:- start:10768 stop:10935 length:168 start_codon:yes stop_codon:yes gene_type:complete